MLWTKSETKCIIYLMHSEHDLGISYFPRDSCSPLFLYITDAIVSAKSGLLRIASQMVYDDVKFLLIASSIFLYTLFCPFSQWLNPSHGFVLAYPWEQEAGISVKDLCFLYFGRNCPVKLTWSWKQGGGRPTPCPREGQLYPSLSWQMLVWPFQAFYSASPTLPL